MAVVFNDDVAPAIEPGAAAKPKGKIVYDGAAPSTAPPAVTSTPSPASSGAAPSPIDTVPQGDGILDKVARIGQRIAHNAGASPLVGAAETALAAGGNTVGKVASGIAGAVTLPFAGADKAADVVRGVQDATHYEPQTQGAKLLAAGGAQVARPFQAAAAPIDNAVGNMAPGPRTAIEAAEEAIPAVASVLPFGQAARVAKASEAVAGAAKPAAGDPLGTVRGAGYIARPSDVRATGAAAPGIVRETMVNSPSLAKTASLKNQQLTTRLAGEDMGVQNATQLTDADYDKFRTNGPGKVYDATAQALGKMPTDPTTVSNLNSLAANPNPATAIPAKAAANVSRIAKKIESGNYDGASWRTDVSWLRANGARDAADELESMAERSLAGRGQTPQVTAFQAARQDFAKSYDYQAATAKRGQVDAQALAALDAKYPGLLTGNAKVIATAGRHLPDVTGVPGGGVNDMATTRGHGVSGALSAAHQVVGAGLKLLPGMNPLSEGFQTQNFGRTMTPVERSYVPDFGRKGAGSTPFAPRMDLAPPPGPTENSAQLGFSLAPGRPPAPDLKLAAPAGQVGIAPVQQPLTMPPGRAPAPGLDLAPPPGTVGIAPTQVQAPLAAPQKRLGDVLAPAEARRLERQMKRREGNSPPGGPNMNDRGA